MAKEPGSAMHLHQSIVDVETRKNIFSNGDGSPSPLFFGHIAGLQKYLPGAMSLFAPNVNSYRRISRHSSAPINVHWGYDNRTAGLRYPCPAPRPGASRIAWEAPTRIPTSRLRHHWPAAISEWSRGFGPQNRSPAAPMTWRSPCRAPWQRRCACCASPSRW